VRFRNCIFGTFLHIRPFQNNNCAIFLKCNFKIWTFFAHFCTFAHFESEIVGLPFFVALWKSANVWSHFFVTLWKSANVQSHFFVALWKSAIVWLHFCRSLKMCDCAIALFVALWKCAIMQLHFSNVQQNVWSHNGSFEMSECAKMCEFWNRTFLHVKKSNCTFSECAIAQPWFLF